MDGIIGDPMAELTPRESEILHLMSLGLSDKQIALHCEIRLGTVKCHVRSVLRKMDAINRTEAVHNATTSGQLDLSPKRTLASSQADERHFNISSATPVIFEGWS